MTFFFSISIVCRFASYFSPLYAIISKFYIQILILLIYHSRMSLNVVYLENQKQKTKFLDVKFHV